MKITVKYSLDRDVQNYLNSVYKFRYLKHGREGIVEQLLRPYPEEFKVALKSATDEEQARNIIKDFLSQGLEARQKKYSDAGEQLALLWLEKEPEIKAELEQLYQQKFPFEETTVYYTSLSICPYNFDEKWIMVHGKAPVEIQIQILKHELNHFMFYYYYGDLKKKLPKEKYESLKEALTVFTNPEEQGKPNHLKLREWLKTQKGSIPEILATDEWQKYLPQ